MSSLSQIFNAFIHLDVYLASIVQNYGIWTYPFLFIIIFLETGVVLTPFLPGDSLLFAAGAIAALGNLNVLLLLALIILAAILGDTANYWIGFHIGKRVFLEKNLINIKYFNKAEKFYEKNGAKTIFLARFIPILRTFAPFVAGIAKMRYSVFLFYNFLGGIIWASLFLLAGYFLGSIEFIKQHFSLFIILIILVSLIPLVIELLKKHD